MDSGRKRLRPVRISDAERVVRDESAAWRRKKSSRKPGDKAILCHFPESTEPHCTHSAGVALENKYDA